jgi:hypothetical protein
VKRSNDNLFARFALFFCLGLSLYMAGSAWWILDRMNSNALLFGPDESFLQLTMIVGGLAAADLGVAIVFVLWERFIVASWLAGAITIVGIASTILVGSLASVALTILSGVAVYFLRREAGNRVLDTEDLDEFDA